ncbi:hypothetical protein IGL15_001051 [Enterococcus sp. DIV0436a]
MKKNDPEATVTINEYKHYRVVSGTHQDFLVEEYKPYLTDETGIYVSVSVTLKGKSEPKNAIIGYKRTGRREKLPEWAIDQEAYLKKKALERANRQTKAPF